MVASVPYIGVHDEDAGDTASLPFSARNDAHAPTATFSRKSSRGQRWANSMQSSAYDSAIRSRRPSCGSRASETQSGARPRDRAKRLPGAPYKPGRPLHLMISGSSVRRRTRRGPGRGPTRQDSGPYTNPIPEWSKGEVSEARGRAAADSSEKISRNRRFC